MFFWRGGGGVGRELVELSSLNTTSNYVDVSFFFLTEYNTTEQEQE